MASPVERTASGREYKVKDMSQAYFGRLQIGLAEVQMPALMSCRTEFGPSQPLKGARITGSKGTEAKGLLKYGLEVIYKNVWLKGLYVILNRGSDIIQFVQLACESFELLKVEEKLQSLLFVTEDDLVLDVGYRIYMAIIVNMIVEEPNMENITVVPKFSKVFSKELPDLLSEREIEFVIELALGIEPIPKAPYRMALSELKELKVQMHELLDKGFKRPSASPWGAPSCS
ncbi:adenosylhomocysteinase-like [Eucalyptus grandis]|uniref:adenosylhomocysteinase-like n=1 Tax=Eucalyptus grandis TaxID=71139 RepID=UPI00192EED4D|nr:adenosylhomocysteinase-like [Eucalyptus grandis]